MSERRKLEDLVTEQWGISTFIQYEPSEPRWLDSVDRRHRPLVMAAREMLGLLLEQQAGTDGHLDYAELRERANAWMVRRDALIERLRKEHETP